MECRPSSGLGSRYGGNTWYGADFNSVSFSVLCVMSRDLKALGHHEYTPNLGQLSLPSLRDR